MKKKLKLENLKVQSFITMPGAETRKVKGGHGDSADTTCRIPCAGPVDTEFTCVGCPTGDTCVTCDATCPNTCAATCTIQPPESVYGPLCLPTDGIHRICPV